MVEIMELHKRIIRALHKHMITVWNVYIASMQFVYVVAWFQYESEFVIWMCKTCYICVGIDCYIVYEIQ